MIYFGTVAFGESSCRDDRYAELKKMGLFQEVKDHPYQGITTEEVGKRLSERPKAFELRQQAKRSNETHSIRRDQ